MGLLQLAAIAAGILALAGAGRPRWVRRAHAYWPVPLMAFALFVGARDLAALLVPQHASLATPSLVLGVWAALVVNLVGWIEIGAARRGSTGPRALMGPALLVATGFTLLVDAARTGSDGRPLGLAAGLAVVLAGAVLATARMLPSPALALRVLWPAALLLAAVSGIDRCPPRDPLAEARRELAIVLTSWRREGREVVQVALPPTSGIRAAQTEGFRVDGNDVRVYLIAHDDRSSPEAHRLPQLGIPPPTRVPHLHVGPHLAVVCVTSDLRFAQRLDALVRGLSGPGRGRSTALAGRSASSHQPDCPIALRCIKLDRAGCATGPTLTRPPSTFDGRPHPRATRGPAGLG